jgi:hypothetical protein
MATIPTYLARGTAVGQKQTVKTKKVVWLPVGDGVVSACSDFVISVDGKINVVVYSGPLNIRLQLTDEDPTAQSGPCVLQLNSHTDESAIYQANGKVLTVAAVLGGQKQNISISPCNGGTQTECKLFGRVNETVHLEPS